MAQLRWLLAALLLATFGVAACGSDSSGMPKTDGEYPVQARSVNFDGKAYDFLWADASGALHNAHGRDVKMQQNQRTFLEMTSGQPVLHLSPEEPVMVRGRDQNGAFSSFWFPFMLGQAMGGIGGGGPPVVINRPSSGPGYHYPPTDQFGRGDTLHGSATTAQPGAPDYRKITPAPNAVSGQNSGAGGGTAASSKPGGAGALQGGQAGGSGTGDAAANKGTAPSLSGQSGGSGTGSAATDRSGPGLGTKPSSGSRLRPSAPARRR